MTFAQLKKWKQRAHIVAAVPVIAVVLPLLAIVGMLIAMWDGAAEELIRVRRDVHELFVDLRNSWE